MWKSAHQRTTEARSDLDLALRVYAECNADFNRATAKWRAGDANFSTFLSFKRRLKEARAEFVRAEAALRDLDREAWKNWVREKVDVRSV